MQMIDVSSQEHAHHSEPTPKPLRKQRQFVGCGVFSPHATLMRRGRSTLLLCVDAVVQHPTHPLLGVAVCFLCAACLFSGCRTETVETEDPPEAEQVTQQDEPQAPEYLLDEAETARLWEMEHHGNLLSKHGFKPFVKALQQQDREQLLAVFPEDFSAQHIDFEKTQPTKIQTEVIDAARYEVTHGESRVLPRSEFVDWYLEQRQRFADDPLPNGRFDVMTIFPPDEEAGEPYWSLTCINRLWGAARDGGQLEILVRMKLRTEDLTAERLGEPAWLVDCEILQMDAMLSQRTLFQDATADSDIQLATLHDNWTQPPAIVNTGGVYACDYNRDGKTDLVVTDANEDAGCFYRGVGGGKFFDVSRVIGLDALRNTSKVAFADLDNDGWEDIILVDSGLVFRNKSGLQFEDYRRESNLAVLLNAPTLPNRFLSAIVPADYDLDGDIDLYVTRGVPPTGSWLESVQPQFAQNQLLRNDGDWNFVDVTAETKTDAGGRSCFSAIWTDVNNDRWPDLYVINEFGNGALYVNQQGEHFEERQVLPNQSDFGSMGLTCGDFNNDGNFDIYVANMYSKAGSRIMGNMRDDSYPPEIMQRLRSMVAGGELYSNQGDSTFKPVGKQFQIHAAGWAYGCALADFDNDGWLDLHVTAGFMSRDRTKPDG